MEVVDAEIAPRCLFVQRGQHRGCGCRESTPRCSFVCSERAVWMFWMQRDHTKMFVCLFREVSVEVVDAERAHQDQVAAAERREREERVAADLLQSLVDSTVDEQLSQIIQKEVE